MQTAKLRVGLLLDSFDTNAWFFKMIEILRKSSYAEINLVILNDVLQKKLNKTIFTKIRNNFGRINYLIFRKFLLVLYSKLIERNTHLPDAFEEKNLKILLTNVPVVKVKPIRKKWSDYICEDDIKIIKEHNIDIFIRKGFRILRGNILCSANYGIWSFHHGDNLVNRGGPPGFWESMENWPETGSILQILTEDLDNGRVLYRSFSCTDQWSVKDNRSNYFWKSLAFIPRKMEELYKKGEDEFFKSVDFDNRHPVFYSNRLYVSPNNSELAKLTFLKIMQKARLLISKYFFFEQWLLMFHLKSEFSSSLWRYKKIIPPKDRFWADPHILYKNKNYYIFIEEFIYKTNKAHVSLIVMDESGNYQKPVKILDKPYHLSYPFVFEYKNEFYMIPETKSNKTIELYKCTDFPKKWEWQMNLMENVRAVDATVLFYNTKWWMFVNIAENKGSSTSDELFVFYAKDLLGNEWISHPMNPVVSDCKSARPAGGIFEKEGRLYRPSQNFSMRYGYGFNISHIEILDENVYQEKIVSKVEPNWAKNIIATHTFNRANRLHIIDALVRRQKWHFFRKSG